MSTRTEILINLGPGLIPNIESLAPGVTVTGTKGVPTAERWGDLKGNLCLKIILKKKRIGNGLLGKKTGARKIVAKEDSDLVSFRSNIKKNNGKLKYQSIIDEFYNE